MTLATTAALAVDSAFRARVTSAVIAAALQVSGEAVDHTRDQEPGYGLWATLRQQLATRALQATGDVVSAFSWAVASNPAIASAGDDASDNDIQYAVTTVWDDIAGASPALALAAPYIPIPAAAPVDPGTPEQPTA